MKRTLIVLCALLTASFVLASCADNMDNKLPSLEDAKKIQNGMTYFEAVEILGSWGAGVPTSIWRHEWELSNGQFLLVSINDHSQDAPTLYEVQIVDESWGGNGVDVYLRTMKVFDTIAEYNEYASGPYQLYGQINEPYEDAEPNRSSPYYIYASALQCLGEFERYYYAPVSSGPNRYFYYFTDANGYQLKVMIQENRQTIPYLDGDTPCLERIPDGIPNMSNIATDAWNAYYDRNGLLYCYTKSGKLSSIRWVDNNVAFALSGSLDSYPMDGEDTLVKRMLSASDQEAERAWSELKSYIGNNNKKPVSWRQILSWMGVTVLAAGTLTGALLLIHKTRAKKTVAQQETVEDALD